MTADLKISEMYDELVPASGKADTVAGEIIRAVSRIVYRNWNDGDHIGVGYGNETCNAAARYLMKETDREIAEIASGMWGMVSDQLYDKSIEILEEEVVRFIEQNPELKTKPNDKDMWSYSNREEDRDDSWDEEEEE